MSRRTERIAEQLRSEIARVLSAEATDPRIRFVTLTRVDVDPNLSRAVVYWSAIETESSGAVEQIGAGLRSAASFVRSRLAQVLPLRRIPEIHFRFDPSLVKGDEMLALLKTLSSDREDTESATELDPSGAEASGSGAAAIIEGTDVESS
jgi:ribosome-binding factor A